MFQTMMSAISWRRLRMQSFLRVLCEISPFPSLGFLETPLYKGLELSEGGCFTLTQPSLNPHAGVWREVGVQ